MDRNGRLESVIAFVTALVVVIGAVDHKTTIGLQSDDGRDIPLDNITGFVSKLNEPLNLWCESNQEWDTCYWIWDMVDGPPPSQKHCRILLNGSLEGLPGCSVSGKRCLFKSSKTTQEEHEGILRCKLGIKALK